MDNETLTAIQKHFISSKSTDKERWNTMNNIQRYFQHGIDPHTATAAVPWQKDDPIEFETAREKSMPVIILETSHSAQFRDEISAQ